jgi:hypothetical protein
LDGNVKEQSSNDVQKCVTDSRTQLIEKLLKSFADVGQVSRQAYVFPNQLLLNITNCSSPQVFQAAFQLRLLDRFEKLNSEYGYSYSVCN